MTSVVQSLNHVGNGFVHPAAEFHGAGTGSRVAQPFPHHGLSQNGGGCGAIAGFVLGFRGHLLHQLGAQIFEGIVKLDLTSNGVTVIDDVWSSEFLFEHHVAAPWTDRHADSVCQCIDTPLESTAGFV